MNLIDLCVNCTAERDFRKKPKSERSSISLREKCPNTELFLVCIFLNSD